MLLDASGNSIESKETSKKYATLWQGLKATLINWEQNAMEEEKAQVQELNERRRAVKTARCEGGLIMLRGIAEVMKKLETGELKVGVRTGAHELQG